MASVIIFSTSGRTALALGTVVITRVPPTETGTERVHGVLVDADDEGCTIETDGQRARRGLQTALTAWMSWLTAAKANARPRIIRCRLPRRNAKRAAAALPSRY